MVSSKKEGKPPPNYSENPPNGNGTIHAADDYPEADDCCEDFPDLTLKEKFCYGVGHVFNDLCASMWFSYLLIFFEKVIGSLTLQIYRKKKLYWFISETILFFFFKDNCKNCLL